MLGTPTKAQWFLSHVPRVSMVAHQIRATLVGQLRAPQMYALAQAAHLRRALHAPMTALKSVLSANKATTWTVMFAKLMFVRVMEERPLQGQTA
jgi:hypothetical protein